MMFKILFFLGVVGVCLGGLDELNNAVASFAKESLEELSGVEDDFTPANGTITLYNGRALISIAGSLRGMEVRGVGGISNVTVQVNLGGKGTDSDPQLILSMEIINPTVRGTHDLKGHVGNSIILGNELTNNTWTATPSLLTISCSPRISTVNGYVRLAQCVPRSLINSQKNAFVEFVGLVNDTRVDPEMLDDLNAIVLDRSSYQNRIGQTLFQKIVTHLQSRFDEVKLLDMLTLNVKPKNKVNVRPMAGAGLGFDGHVASNTMSERMNSFARQVITNFTKTTPDPFQYRYNVSLEVDLPLVNISGYLSNIGFAGLARDFRFNVSSNADTDSYNFVRVSIDIFDAELTGHYNLEGSIASATEKIFQGQGLWSIKNISVTYFLFEPRMELDGIYFKQRSTLMSGFRMDIPGSELKMPGLLDNVDVTESVKDGVMEILRPQIISLMNSRLSDEMQRLIANEMFRKFEEIPAVEIFLM